MDSIRTFDPESQRSVERLETLSIYPASELILTEDEVENGSRRLEEGSQKQEKAFRDALKAEEAHRVKQTVNEVY